VKPKNHRQKHNGVGAQEEKGYQHKRFVGGKQMPEKPWNKGPEKK